MSEDDARTGASGAELDHEQRFTDEAYSRLERELQAFAKATGKACPKCGKPMVRRVKKSGKDGKGGYDFWGCSGWPECSGKV